MASDRTMVLIRERALVDVFDLTLVVLRKRAVTLGLAALIGIVPFLAFNAWFFAQIDPEDGVTPCLLWLLEAPFATAPLTVVLGSLMFGQKATAGKMASTMLRSAFPLVLIHGLFRFIPFFWIPPRLAFANEVTLLERKWWKVWRRGGDLTNGRAGELFCLEIFQIIVIIAFVFFAFIGSTVAFSLVMSETPTWDIPWAATLAGPRVQVPIWIGVAFFAVARFLIYIDQRIRLEGWEVELQLRTVGEAMEQEALRW